MQELHGPSLLLHFDKYLTRKMNTLL